MARNLTTSTCVDCKEHTFKLEDMRGQAVEFRQYFDEPPQLGCKVICPNCERQYFAIWRPAEWNGFRTTRGFVIDLSYYESFNDEPSHNEQGDYNYDDPHWICRHNADNWQDIW